MEILTVMGEPRWCPCVLCRLTRMVVYASIPSLTETVGKVWTKVMEVEKLSGDALGMRVANLSAEAIEKIIRSAPWRERVFYRKSWHVWHDVVAYLRWIGDGPLAGPEPDIAWLKGAAAPLEDPPADKANRRGPE